MKQLFTFVLAAMAFVACTQNDVEELSANRADVPETLTVGFEGGDTRIELNEALKTVWTEGDEVSVFYRSYENTRWAFQGETGDRSCELRLVSGEVGAQTMDNSIIVYPYSDSYAIDADTHAVAALLPAVQSYKEGSYGAEGNIMVAESKFTQFTLKSIVGWLRVELTGNRHIVNSITLCGNDGEPVAGLCYINAADASVALAASDVDESLVATEVVLNCGSGVMLGAEAKKFYIALLPQTFEKGLTVEVNYANAEPQTLVYEDSITIRRNHISPINIEAQGEAIIRTDKLFYTATALVEPDEATAFNVAIVSNEWDEATGEGVITFNGELTTIGYEAFAYCDSLTSVTIPESVTTIGNNAFWYCGNLTSVTIPESVTTIGDYAFRHCSSLTSVTIPTNTTTIGEGAFVWCESLTSVTIPNNVTTIGNGAFAACISLAEFKGKFAADGGRCLIKDNTIIAYANASGTTYTIGDSVTSIGDYAFHSCSSLTSVTIPESVTTIGDHAFIYCDSLTSVYCKATTPPAGGVGMFYDTSATIYVPEDSLREYKMAENWSEYADYIVGYNFEAGEETPETPSDFVPTHTATKWLWSGPSSYGNKYAVSGDGFTVDVHFPTDVATESSLATGEYVWMVTSFFSNSDATNFTTRSFKLGGSDDTVPISDGSAKVTASGDVYTIQLTLVHRDSGEKYMIEYVGKLNDAGEQGGGEVNPDGAIKLTRFAYDMDMCSHYLGYFWRASGENVSLGVAITSRSCTQDSINAGDYVYNAYPDDIEYAFQLRNSTYNGVSVGDSNSTMKVEKSGEVYKITIVASGHTFVYEGTLN